MDTYRLELSWSELDTLKASMNRTIDDLEKITLELEAMLDEDLDLKQYSLYLGSLANITRDKANMRSILCKAEMSHD